MTYGPGGKPKRNRLGGFNVVHEHSSSKYVPMKISSNKNEKVHLCIRSYGRSHAQIGFRRGARG